MKHRNLELLSPAANAETAIQAIIHGADAVYIGPPSHGARKSAANSIEEIEKVVEFAHQFRAKVYATVNTIVYDNELKKVESLCRDLYNAGVDALIVQDMGILRLNLPPIALHASTQCDIRTPQKARFLQEVGFSQLVLARELTLTEIKEIVEAVSIPVETFIHGALCVSYSGRCHASMALTGRSANRGECAQICRLPFSLTDADGNIIEKDKYLLSLKDLNASHSLKNLVEAGVSSFKIEGRLKDTAYVKNITSLYHLQLNNIISESEGYLSRSSFGEVTLKFVPKADKSFNRGFSDYFLTHRKPLRIASLKTPKSQGEIISDISQLNNGDGISFFDKSGAFTGVNVNKIEANKIFPARKIDIPASVIIHRTSDIRWDKLMASETASRKIKVAVTISNDYVEAEDQRGLKVRIPLDIPFEQARKPMDYQQVFEKLGDTIYVLSEFKSNLDPSRFYPVSLITSLRRKLFALLDEENNATLHRDCRRQENLGIKYPYPVLDFRDNVANHLAEEFYYQHGVESISKAAEISDALKSNDIVMTTRHCILRELGLCKARGKDVSSPGSSCNLKYPLYLKYDGGRFRLDFDCRRCEMFVRLP